MKKSKPLLMPFFLIVFLMLSIYSFSQTVTWTGTTDTDWHKACNWSTSTIPVCTDNVVVPNTANKPNVTGIAHCKTVTVNTDAGAIVTVNSSGSGILYVSSINTCVGTPTDNGGCAVPSTSWTVNGTTLLYKPGGYPCTPVIASSHVRTLTNNTGYDITVTIPPISCSNKSAGSVFTILAGASYNLTISQSGCCINGGDGTVVATWTATDGGSGSFNIDIVVTL